MKKTIAILATLTAAMLVAPVAAEARTDSPTARGLAIGDAGRAIGMGTEGLFYNVGAIAQVTQYAINFGYSYSNWNQWHQASASFVDSQTNKWLTGGVSYTFGYADEGDDTMTHDIRAALGFKYANDNVFIGLGSGMRVMNLRSEYTDSRWYVDLDLGVLLGIKQIFYVGVTGQNLVQGAAQDKNIAEIEFRSPTRRYWNIAPRKLGVGVGITYSIFNMGIDCDVDFSTDVDGDKVADITPSLNAGMEFMIKNVVALRAGVAWDRVGHYIDSVSDNDQELRVSLGVGYVSKAVAVDVGYAHDVFDASGFYLQTTIRVFLP